MFVSVIIPTYNRKKHLHDTLISLARQTWSNSRFEVIIVDDGSTDGTKEIIKNSFPFALHYIRQSNQGDAIARNTGAEYSRADILVFLDDDMLVEPDYLDTLIAEHQPSEKKIVVGTEYLLLEDKNPLVPLLRSSKQPIEKQRTIEHPFTFVFSRNMSISREPYLSLGGMDNLGFSGSSIWCDVDFAYRAYLQEYQFLRSTRAICYHRDYVARNLVNAKKRNWEAAYRSVVLFRKYPDLLPFLPMFSDKTPINWHQDSLKITIRKKMRSLASSKSVLNSLEITFRILERWHSPSNLLDLLHRWIVGGYIYRGFQEGLRDFGPIVVNNFKPDPSFFMGSHKDL